MNGRSHCKRRVHFPLLFRCDARAFGTLLFLLPQLGALLLGALAQRFETRVRRCTIASACAHVECLICAVECEKRQTCTIIGFGCAWVQRDDSSTVAQYRAVILCSMSKYIDGGSGKETQT